jgi:steroid delta-isomerase-like uncharacterized protein
MSSTASITAATPSEERARAIFRRLFDERDLTDPHWYWADDVVVRLHALDTVVHGPAGMAAFFTELFAAVPDWRMEVEEVLGHDGAATIRWRGTGTHTGQPWRGIAATGRRIDLPGCDVMRFGADGRVVETIVYYDGATFARQVGMLPKQDSAADRALLAAFNAAARLRRRARRAT